MPDVDTEFNAAVQQIDEEMTRRLNGKRPTRVQIAEYWGRVQRARREIVERRTREAIDRVVEGTFKLKGLPMKALGNHQYFVKPTSHRVLEFSTLEEINRKLTNGKKIRAIKAHQGGMIIIIS